MLDDSVREILIAAWHTRQTMVEIGRSVGMTGRAVRWHYNKLAKQRLVPSGIRKHMPQSARARGPYHENGKVTVGKPDRLLERLIEVHGLAYLLRMDNSTRRIEW